MGRKFPFFRLYVLIQEKKKKKKKERKKEKKIGERDVHMQMKILGSVVFMFSLLFANIWVQKVKLIPCEN
jgi:hypothetical protein